MLLPVAVFIHDVSKLIELLTLVQATCPALRNADELAVSEEARVSMAVCMHIGHLRVCVYSAV